MKLWRYGYAIERLSQRYRLEGALGSGGMADVCLAWDEREEREVAIKIIKPDQLDQRTLDRFVKEAAQVARWRHPNILHIYSDLKLELLDAAQGSILPYIVMEYARGGDLHKRLSPGVPYPLGATLHIFAQLCRAVAYAHEHGIIHRDLKPLNVLFRVLPAGDEQVVLSDFGLAVEMNATHLTFARGGTLLYMAPEQLRGQVQPASDIFALGVILYQLCTGHLPFRRSLHDLHPNAPVLVPPAPGTLVAALPPALDDVILTAINADPTRRFATAAALWDAVHEAVGTVLPCSPSSPWSKPRQVRATYRPWESFSTRPVPPITRESPAASHQHPHLSTESQALPPPVSHRTSSRPGAEWTAPRRLPDPYSSAGVSSEDDEEYAEMPSSEGWDEVSSEEFAPPSSYTHEANDVANAYTQSPRSAPAPDLHKKDPHKGGLYTSGGMVARCVAKVSSRSASDAHEGRSSWLDSRRSGSDRSEPSRPDRRVETPLVGVWPTSGGAARRPRKALPPLSRPGLPSLRHQPRRYTVPLLLVGALCVLGVLASLWSFTPLYSWLGGEVTVTITPASKLVSHDYTVQVGTGGQATNDQLQQVDGRAITFQQPAQAIPVQGTGHAQAQATQARGKLTFINGSGIVRNINAGTMITGADGIQIVTDANISIPAANPAANQFGISTVSAHAVNAGLVGNIQKLDIDEVCCVANKVVSVRNDTPFAGGQDAKDYHYVQQSDVDSATDAAANRLAHADATAVQPQLRPGEVLAGNPGCTPKVTTADPVGDQGRDIPKTTTTVTATCQAVAYNQQAMRALIEPLWRSDSQSWQGQGYGAVGPIQLQTVVQEVGADGSALVTVMARGTWVYRLSQQRLRDLARMIAGKDAPTAIRLVKSQTGIVDVKVPQRMLPEDVTRIIMVVTTTTG